MFEDPKRTKKYLKVALQGGAKVGKTRFALSFPDPHVVDGERGSDAYAEKYGFHVRHTNRWKGLGEEVTALVEHPIVGATLVVDLITVFYKDLLNDLVQEVKNKRGHETLSQSEWTKENRRWFAFLNMLVQLPMHVVLVSREREEYVESVNNRGEEVRKKTGNFIMECDKQTEFLFDVIIRVHTEENKKEKTSKHLATVLGSRYSWAPKYATYDVTQKRAFDMIFSKHVGVMLDAPDAPPADAAEPLVVPDSDRKPDEKSESSVDTRGAVDRVGEVLEKFAGPGDQEQPQATLEDVKVLMTLCNKMKWPDGSPFKSADGKAMIKGLYKLESTKDLRKYQVDFLGQEFGEVLAGRAALERDETGTPFVRRLSGVAVDSSSK
jgi:hypothetical protein